MTLEAKALMRNIRNRISDSRRPLSHENRGDLHEIQMGIIQRDLSGLNRAVSRQLARLGADTSEEDSARRVLASLRSDFARVGLIARVSSLNRTLVLSTGYVGLRFSLMRGQEVITKATLWNHKPAPEYALSMISTAFNQNLDAFMNQTLPGTIYRNWIAEHSRTEIRSYPDGEISYPNRLELEFEKGVLVYARLPDGNQIVKVAHGDYELGKMGSWTPACISHVRTNAVESLEVYADDGDFKYAIANDGTVTLQTFLQDWSRVFVCWASDGRGMYKENSEGEVIIRETAVRNGAGHSAWIAEKQVAYHEGMVTIREGRVVWEFDRRSNQLRMADRRVPPLFTDDRSWFQKTRYINGATLVQGRIIRGAARNRLVGKEFVHISVLSPNDRLRQYWFVSDEHQIYYSNSPIHDPAQNLLDMS